MFRSFFRMFLDFLIVFVFMLFVMAAVFFSEKAHSSTYIKGPALIEDTTQITVSGGTTVLTKDSQTNQLLSGTGNQTLDVPSATTLPLSRYFVVINRATGSVTVRNNGGVTLKVIPTNMQVKFMVTDISTANGVWDVSNINVSSVTGLLPLANGGTNNSITPLNGALIYSTASNLNRLSTLGGSGDILTSNGVGTPPSWGPSPTTYSWLLNGNALGADGLLGLTTNFNLQLIANNDTQMTVTPSGIGIPSAPSLSTTALLELNGFGGFVLPRVTSASIGSLNPTSGMMVFNVTNNRVECYVSGVWGLCATGATGQVKITVLSSGSGTYTVPAGARSLIVEIVGGGGGGSTNPNSGFAGGGGGAGAYCKHEISTPAASYTYSVGAAGAIAGAGGNTTFGSFTMGGGDFGKIGTSSSIGGVGGPITAACNKLNIVGEYGFYGLAVSSNQVGGQGGSNPLGVGGHPANAANGQAAAVGSGCGAGGGGGANTITGSAGTAGCIVITGYY